MKTISFTICLLAYVLPWYLFVQMARVTAESHQSLPLSRENSSFVNYRTIDISVTRGVCVTVTTITELSTSTATKTSTTSRTTTIFKKVDSLEKRLSYLKNQVPATTDSAITRHKAWLEAVATTPERFAYLSKRDWNNITITHTQRTTCVDTESTASKYLTLTQKITVTALETNIATVTQRVVAPKPSSAIVTLQTAIDIPPNTIPNLAARSPNPGNHNSANPVINSANPTPVQPPNNNPLPNPNFSLNSNAGSVNPIPTKSNSPTNPNSNTNPANQNLAQPNNIPSSGSNTGQPANNNPGPINPNLAPAASNQIPNLALSPTNNPTVVNPAPGQLSTITTYYNGNPITVVGLPPQAWAGPNTLVVDGATILPGSAITKNELVYSNGPTGLLILPAVTTPGAIIASIVGASLIPTPNAAAPVIISGQTLTQGGTLIISGTTYLLPSSGSVSLTISPFTASAPSTPTPGPNYPSLLSPSATLVISGTTLTIPPGVTAIPGGILVISGSTYTLPPTPTSPPAAFTTIGNFVISFANPTRSLSVTSRPVTGIIINGQTLTQGGTVVISGTTYSLPTEAALPIPIATGPSSGSNGNNSTAYIQVGGASRNVGMMVAKVKVVLGVFVALSLVEGWNIG